MEFHPETQEMTIRIKVSNKFLVSASPRRVELRIEYLLLPPSGCHLKKKKGYHVEIFFKGKVGGLTCGNKRKYYIMYPKI
jgi:hypothetical protein